MTEAAIRLGDQCVWHDVEHAAYSGDLAAFEAMAQRFGGPVIDLGAGTGRVALHLAGRGHRVLAVEIDPALAGAMERRAAAGSLPVEVVVANARHLALETHSPLVLAPMQFMHIAGGPGGRAEVLRSVRGILAPGGRFAAAVLQGGLPAGVWRPDPVPDVREVDGWVYSSLATSIEVGESTIVLSRLRQIVSPDGDLQEQLDQTVLDRFTMADLEREAFDAGLAVTGIEPLPYSAEHEDSSIVTMVEREGDAGHHG